MHIRTRMQFLQTECAGISAGHHLVRRDCDVYHAPFTSEATGLCITQPLSGGARLRRRSGWHYSATTSPYL